MNKRWFLAGLLLLVPGLLGGCGVAQEQYDAVAAELDKAQQVVQSARADMDSARAEALELTAGLGEAEAELESVRSELTAIQSSMEAQEKIIANARTFTEVVSMIFVPALTGESVDEVELLFQWGQAIKDTGDAELQRLFDAVVDSDAGDRELMDFFIYIFETLPKMLES